MSVIRPVEMFFIYSRMVGWLFLGQSTYRKYFKGWKWECFKCCWITKQIKPSLHLPFGFLVAISISRRFCTVDNGVCVCVFCSLTVHSFADDQGGLAPPPSNTVIPDIKPTPPSSERGPGSARSSDKMSSARRPSASKRSSAGRSRGHVWIPNPAFLLKRFLTHFQFFPSVFSPRF